MARSRPQSRKAAQADNLPKRPGLTPVREAEAPATPVPPDDDTPADVKPAPAIVPSGVADDAVDEFGVGEDAVLEDVARVLFGGKGDHDGDGKPGGAHAPVDEPDAEEVPVEPVVEPEPEVVRTSATEKPSVPREKTLNELNIESRAQDAARRQEIEEIIYRFQDIAGDRFEEVIRIAASRQYRQKPARPPVTA